MVNCKDLNNIDFITYNKETGYFENNKLEVYIALFEFCKGT